MEIPKRISEKDLEGLLVYLDAVVLGKKFKKIPLRTMKYSIFLEVQPYNAIPIGSDEFRQHEILAEIPRSILHELAEIAGVNWSEALKMSVYDLVILSKRNSKPDVPGYNDERDNFIVEQRGKGVPASKIIEAIQKHKDWYPIETPQGIYRAERRHQNSGR